MINNSKEWVSIIRDVSFLPSAPIQQTDGRWKITERLELWKQIGPRIFDDYLDRFQKVAVEVLRERDPQFDLNSGQRHAANIYGKVTKHSHQLRNGLAETLALLGNYHEYLTSCSLGRAQDTAILTVRAILNGANWDLWASLDDVLPLLAEATPGEFLTAVEKSLSQDPSPFDEVFAQESTGFAGRNYMSSLLWALEALAWDEEYLIRVIVILGDLAARDPGGNWSNRPINSLSTILLPWLPQTLAPITKRLLAVATLQRERKEIAWKLILSLLPEVHQSSSMTHKPVWKKPIPPDHTEGVTNKEYWEQITHYADMAVDMAMQDRSKLVTIIDYINQIPQNARRKLLSYIASDEIASLPQEERLPIWNKLVYFVATQRRFAGADWVLNSEDLEQIDGIAAALIPEAPVYKYQRLFTDQDYLLYEETDNYEEEAEKLQKTRIAAVREVFSQGGIQALIKFAQEVDSPYRVGFAFGSMEAAVDDHDVLPAFLETKLDPLIQFAAGFVSGGFRTYGWQWVDDIDVRTWTNEQKAVLLGYLPFTSETWKRAKNLLGDQEDTYWTKTHANPYEATNDELIFAIDRLVKNHRVLEAVTALDRLSYRKGTIEPQQIVGVLNLLLRKPESFRRMSPRSVVQLIRKLQESPDTVQDELFRIEWEFLPLLDGNLGVVPRLLERKLASDPAFFGEVIRAVFRSEKKNRKTKKTTDEQNAIARNAYRLLMKWKTPPGIRDDRTFNGDELNTWLDKVKQISNESGHLKISMQQVGEVLFYAPPNPDGRWIHDAVAAVLNAKDANELRRGFSMEIFNSRGVYAVDPEGKPERELAKHYRNRAEEIEMRGFHRLAGTLREIAESYDREAERVIANERLEY